jgi:hypothetical protein
MCTPLPGSTKAAASHHHLNLMNCPGNCVPSSYLAKIPDDIRFRNTKAKGMLKTSPPRLEQGGGRGHRGHAGHRPSSRLLRPPRRCCEPNERSDMPPTITCARSLARCCVEDRRDCVHARSRDYPSIATWTARQCATRFGRDTRKLFSSVPIS